MPATTGAPGGGPDLPNDPAEPPSPPLRWRQVFSGEEAQLATLRQWLESLFPQCPARDDLISVATELASNAIRHTSSGRGGWFAVEIACHEPPSAIRLAVADGGSPEGPRVIDDPMAEHGRGLVLVQGLSTANGVSGDHRGRVVWADIGWPATRGGRCAADDPHEAAIRADQASLQREYAGVPIWFGRSTLKWWALVGGDQLLTASTPREMAGAIQQSLAQRRTARAASAQTAHRRPGPGETGALPFPRQRQATDSAVAQATYPGADGVRPMRAVPPSDPLARQAS
ncbi:MAG TPA: ATP-binding protein [Streptosporangiaceae bacterium]|nr:ATP-binding protein [Streptosporangiaceae bacterium]